MSTFQDAISNLLGKYVEVGTAGEWADKGELKSIGNDHLILQQPNSERAIIVKLDAIEYIKELPSPGATRQPRTR